VQCNKKDGQQCTYTPLAGMLARTLQHLKSSTPLTDIL